ncbi:MAG: 5-formyltetrahydrofolate cyclo-ligase [Pelagibacteraceae bacterium TMED232]|nr:MAG: 5-formyltetrahydrofolate cyclo-ligase [Pelagibacteraceae bacterium TMED232]
MNKSEIRKKILKIRRINNIKNQKIDFKSLIKILRKSKISGRVVGGYYPYNYEVDTLEIFKKLEKFNYHLTLPKISKNYQMDFFQWSTKDPLEINKYGIPEPISEVVKFPNILLVPLVAFDKDRNRIGYGGGFYDRYIKKLQRKKKILTIGLAYSFQKVKKIPVTKHDIQLDFIVTNTIKGKN